MSASVMKASRAPVTGQPVNDGGNGIQVQFVVPGVGLTRENNGFRNTYPREGVGGGRSCCLRSKLSDGAASIPA